jgi:glyoxylase-like metal-dependent hydrolase (beta-lactamase superfamily II)
MAYHGQKLQYIVDTHTHADHVSAAFELKRLTGAKYAVAVESPAPRVDIHVKDGDVLDLAGNPLNVLHTPGHTPDSISIHAGNAVYTG